MARRYVLRIAGMHAVHASRAVETALGGLPGVLAVEATLGEASVLHDGSVGPTALRGAVEAAGFTVTDVVEDRRQRLPLIE
jgi:copper chaperone CopZ